MATLSITFTGLCLFVPDTDGKILHVLMPGTGSGHRHAHDHEQHQNENFGAAVELHNATLEFDSQYDAGTSGGSPVPLNDYKVDLVSSLPDAKHDPALPDLVNLSPIVGAKVDVSQAGEADLHMRITSRVLVRGGRMSHRKGLAKWAFPKYNGKPEVKPLHIAHWVRWTVRNLTLPEGILTITGVNLKTGSDAVLARLKPDTSNKIHICIKHLPPLEIDLDPPLGYKPEHFPAYTALLKGLPRIPELVEKKWGKGEHVTAADQPDNAPRRCEELFRDRGAAKKLDGRTFSCIGASAEPA